MLSRLHEYAFEETKHAIRLSKPEKWHLIQGKDNN